MLAVAERDLVLLVREEEDVSSGGEVTEPPERTLSIFFFVERVNFIIVDLLLLLLLLLYCCCQRDVVRPKKNLIGSCTIYVLCCEKDTPARYYYVILILCSKLNQGTALPTTTTLCMQCRILSLNSLAVTLLHMICNVVTTSTHRLFESLKNAFGVEVLSAVLHVICVVTVGFASCLLVC